MRIGPAVLGYFNQTGREEQQAEQLGGTVQTTVGPPEMRIKIVPILGQMFGGNYGFLIWDETDPDRKAIAVDPADPYPMLRAAKADRLRIVTVLTTHWHFDHAGGNRTLAREIPGLEVVFGAGERGQPPAITRRLRDLEELTVGDLTVVGHAVPGHTHGSIVYEVFSRKAPTGAATSAFTGDAIFCGGGCGALFECSATTLHASLQLLISRLKPSTLIYPGHEYTEMSLTNALNRKPRTAADAEASLMAGKKLAEVRERRQRKLPSIPSTWAEELSYSPHLQADPGALAMLCGATED